MQLWKADQTQMLGVGDFDLGKYANMQEGVEHVDKLPLRSCPFDQQAYIEVVVKVKQTIAIHFYSTEQVVKESFLILRIADIRIVKGNFRCSS